MDGEKARLFEETALSCLNALYCFGLLLTGRPDEAEDLVQETFLRAFRFFHQYEHGTNCKAWLFTIMKHIFLNQSTQRGRLILCRDPNEEGESQSLWEAAIGRSPASSSRDEVFAKDIEKALALLPETFRLVVVLKDMKGFSYGEIARLLDCPIGTVMSRLSRARDLLRRFLQDYAVQGSGSHAQNLKV
jgi:RNA polymerase sigma-70 factor (ECF subfamily)